MISTYFKFHFKHQKSVKLQTTEMLIDQKRNHSSLHWKNNYLYVCTIGVKNETTCPLKTFLILQYFLYLQDGLI